MLIVNRVDYNVQGCACYQYIPLQRVFHKSNLVAVIVTPIDKWTEGEKVCFIVVINNTQMKFSNNIFILNHRFLNHKYSKYKVSSYSTIDEAPHARGGGGNQKGKLG